MLDQLMELVRQSGQQAVVNNPEVHNEHNEGVMQEASASIFSSLQSQLQTGGPGALKSLFEGVQNGDNNHPAIQQVANQFSGNIMQKFGLNSGIAKSIAVSLIPTVLGKLMNRSREADSNSGFNMSSILGSLMGSGKQQSTGQPQAAGGGMLGNLSSMGAKFGLDKDGDGDTDLKDLMSMFSR